MAFTAQDVKTLREITGCGMMDCKKALTETNGDQEKAIELLREKGLAAAAKKAGRIAAEGIVKAYVDTAKKVGVVIEVNAETDFVAKNADFQAFVDTCAQTVVEQNPADVDALLACKACGSEMTIADLTTEKIQTIGENIKIRRFAFYVDGVSVPYIHAGGKIGVLVNLDTDLAPEKVAEVGKDMAMQIAALNPRFLDKSEVDDATLEEEKKILLVQMENDPKMAAKPDKVKQGIVTGKLRKFYEENCLLQQEFVKDNSMSVEQYVAKVAKEQGGSIKLKAAVRFEKGEGIEKKQENFAEEIAKQLAK